ncbi:LptA/OstA family protein [Bauldia litoralis]|uniref:Lipopolysaccharide export system protein LptA n=1 Tax=Bauldia litoralis TaxID=665467 RepID=A0A1G6E1N8_9HYPH|nr:LptA/OstA family protein [Bauldia litoralis]SDB51282.1 lipopolysaccharide export system protein LptA [Bauldia litoralis]
MSAAAHALRLACSLLLAAFLAAPAAAQSTDIFKGFSAKSGGAIQVDADTLEIVEEGEERISTFAGGVTVVRGDTTMKAATIRLHSDKDGGDPNGFTRMEATGTVYVNSGNQTVTGSKAVVDNKAQTITLSGNVVLSQGKNVMTAERLVIDMASGKATLEQMPGKRIQGVFSPGAIKKKDDGDSAAGTKPAQ